MNRRALVLLCGVSVLLHQVVCAQERTLLAEGDSVALTTKGTKPLSHWKLWCLDNGYEVIDSSTRNASSTQTFRFDSKFMPTGFAMKIGPLEISDHRRPEISGSEISCEYKSREILCESIAGDGTRSATKIAAVPPYVVTGEFYDLDFLWFMTGVVHLLQGAKPDGSVNAYAVTSGRGPKEIELKIDKPIRIISDGNGSATMLGRVQPIKKYRWGSAHGRLLTGTEQGFIVKIQPNPSLELGYAIDNYKEHVPWGVPF